jgi:hypothetical protein
MITVDMSPTTAGMRIQIVFAGMWRARPGSASRSAVSSASKALRRMGVTMVNDLRGRIAVSIVASNPDSGVTTVSTRAVTSACTTIAGRMRRGLRRSQ